jgi:tetratricopeptide (TPR) repeat protein
MRFTPKTKGERIFFWFSIVVLIAIAIRCLYFYQQLENPFTQSPISDSKIYILEAEKMLASGDLLGEKIFTFGSSAFYSYFLAFVFFLAGKNFLLVQGIQHFVGALSCGLVLLIGQRLYGIKIGFILALWAAFFSPFLFHEGILLASSWTIFFLSLSLYFLVSQTDESNNWKSFGAGFFLGLAVLCRPNMLLIAPFYMFVFLKPSLQQALKSIRPYVLVLGVLLAILPVTLRNYVVGDDMVLISSGGGWNFYLGNNHEANGLFHIPATSGVANDLLIYEFAHQQAEIKTRKKLSASKGSKFWFRQGIDYLTDNPESALALYWKKFKLFWNNQEISEGYHFDFYSNYSFLLRIPLLSFGIAALLGLVGAFWGVLTGSHKDKLLPIIALSYMCSVLLFFVHSRLRLPMSVFLLIMAGFAMKNITLHFKKISYGVVTLFCLVISALLIFQDLPADAKKINESSSFTYYSLARKFVKSKKFSQALDLFEKAMESDPSNYLIMVEAGKAAEKKGDIKEAERYFTKALTFKRYLPPTVKSSSPNTFPDPRQMAIYEADLQLGKIYLNSGDLNRATQHLLAAENRYAIGLEHYIYLSLVFEKMGRYKDAITACRQYLKFFPGNRQMQIRAAELQKKLEML